jgi:hypothetical protein
MLMNTRGAARDSSSNGHKLAESPEGLNSQRPPLKLLLRDGYGSSSMQVTRLKCPVHSEGRRSDYLHKKSTQALNRIEISARL